MTIEHLRNEFGKHGIQRVKLGVFDIDGALRGKYVSLDKFDSAVTSGIGFCDVLFGWDIADALCDNAKITGWHTGFPDGVCSIDLESFRIIPWEPGTAFFLLDYQSPVAPRQVFRRVLERVQSLGLTPYLSAEYEFFVFRETAESLRAKNFSSLTPLTPGMFGYSVIRAAANPSLFHQIMDDLPKFGIPIEGLHTETGPGVLEAAIGVTSGLDAADRAALFKPAVKEIALAHGVTPTFMAKSSGSLPGSSGHVHQSIWRDGANLFADGVTGPMRHYIAGLVRYVPELMSLFCPTINSYKRTVPGYWAPINSTWGIDNRTTAIRAIPGGAKSSRIELRLTGADINPYLAMAAALAAGVSGFEQELEPPEATVAGYEASNAQPLPRSLAEAAAALRTSELAHDWLGTDFVEHFCGTRDWEVNQYAKAVTDWELNRYFESV